MVTLNFTLAPEAAARVHDLLVCLAKFGETVSIEARHDRLAFTALNSSKSAYASFSLDGQKFFSAYECPPKNPGTEGRFTCSISCKALLSVFKGRLLDPKARDTAIDRCLVSVQEGPGQTECRFIIKMVSNQGVTKTYRLTYEPTEVMHALFDRNSATSRWTIQSGALKEFTDFFAPRTENLDIYAEESRVIFTSYTEKITNGKEILKQPLRTSVAANIADFVDFNATRDMHLIINVKDFRAIVAHAETLKVSITAFYSVPTRPLQFAYAANGMHCEFTLMTSGDYRGPPPTTTTTTAASTARISTAVASLPSGATTAQHTSRTSADIHPSQSTSSARTSLRRSKNPVLVGRASRSETTAEPDPESLFVPQAADDEDAWNPADDRREEETLGWDASGDHDDFRPAFQSTSLRERRSTGEEEQDSFEGLAPTQRVSQIRGLW